MMVVLDHVFPASGRYGGRQLTKSGENAVGGLA
jgi:hypothetical protein